MARITISTLVNQVKKVISSKSAIPALEKAYINGNGDIIASNIEVTAFIAGVFQDAAAQNLNKLYSKDALTVYAKTGVLAGGVDLPESAAGCFKLPEEEFTTICTVAPETLKNCLTAVSRNEARAYLTGFNINMESGYIESCDGFRAYRAPVDIAGRIDRPVVIPGFAGSFGYKGNIEIAAGDKFARLTDSITGLVVYARMLNGPFVNLDAIYNKNANYRAVTVKGLETLKPFLQAAIKLNRSERGAGSIFLRFKGNKLDYSIPGIDICGSLETDNKDMDAAAACYNPLYLMDAIAAAGNTLVYSTTSMNGHPLMVGVKGGPEALLLPIREDRYTIDAAFEKLDSRAPAPAAPVVTDNTPAAPEETPEETTPASDLPNNEETTPDNSPEEAPDAIQEDTAPEETTPAPAPDNMETTPEAAAVAAINEAQNKENRFTNISPEDVKRQQAITAAQAYYKALHGYKVSTIQAITAEAIYQANRDILQPIARRAGGLYIDNIAIIAAITAANDLYTLTEV